MFPEGWLMEPEGKCLLFFEKDPMNPIHEGYIESFLVTGVHTKQLSYRKRTSKAKAIERASHQPITIGNCLFPANSFSNKT